METLPYRGHIRALTRLALPIVGSQFAAMFLWVVDVIMLGHLGTEPLGAASLSRVWIYGSMVFVMGLLFGIDPIASQAFGAKNFDALARNLKRGLLLALGLSVPVGLSWLLTGRILILTGQDPLIAASAHLYALVQIPGLPFFLVFLVLKQFLQAQGIVMPELWITIGANLFNILANWLLIFGHWGFPELGVVGAGVATALTEILMALFLGLWMFHNSDQRRFWAGWNHAILQIAPYKRILSFGWPVAIQIGLEMWAFQIATLWAGWLGDYSPRGPHRGHHLCLCLFHDSPWRGHCVHRSCGQPHWCRPTSRCPTSCLDRLWHGFPLHELLRLGFLLWTNSSARTDDSRLGGDRRRRRHSSHRCRLSDCRWTPGGGLRDIAGNGAYSARRYLCGDRLLPPRPPFSLVDEFSGRTRVSGSMVGLSLRPNPLRHWLGGLGILPWTSPC